MTTQRLGRRGALDLRGLEARRRAHGACVPLRARLADGLGAAVQRVRAGSDRRRRDPRVHRGGARRTRPRDPWGRLADPRVVLRRRHGRGALLALEHPNAVGESFNIGNARSAVTIYDLAQRVKRLTGCPGEIVFQPLHYTDVELRIPNVDKARELLGFEAKVELDEGLERTIAWYRERLRPDERSDPARAAGRRGRRARRVRGGRAHGSAHDGRRRSRSSRRRSRAPSAPRTQRPSRRDRRAAPRAARARDRPGRRGRSSPRTRSRRPRTRRAVRRARRSSSTSIRTPSTRRCGRRGRGHAEDAGRHGRASLRATGRVGGAADRRAAGGRRSSRTRPGRSARATAARRAARSASRRASRSTRARS